MTLLNIVSAMVEHIRKMNAVSMEVTLEDKFMPGWAVQVKVKQTRIRNEVYKEVQLKEGLPPNEACN